MRRTQAIIAWLRLHQKTKWLRGRVRDKRVRCLCCIVKRCLREDPMGFSEHNIGKYMQACIVRVIPSEYPILFLSQIWPVPCSSSVGQTCLKGSSTTRGVD